MIYRRLPYACRYTAPIYLDVIYDRLVSRAAMQGSAMMACDIWPGVPQVPRGDLRALRAAIAWPVLPSMPIGSHARAELPWW